MPYKLRKAPNKPLYWVVTIETGKKHSKDPISMDKAKAQMRVLESVLEGNGKVYLQKLGQLRNEHNENEAKIKREYAKMLKYAQDEDLEMLDVLSSPLGKQYKNAISERERLKKEFQYWRSIQLKEEQNSIQEVEEEPEVERPPGTEAAKSGLSAIRMLRKKKGGKKRGGADQDFDPEMAGLMGEPVQFAPPQANPFAGLFEPRPVRRRRHANKRAVSTVHGAIPISAPKRKKIQGEYRGQGKCNCKPPYHEYSKGKASAFVLTCIDPRYTFDVAFYLQHKKELHQDYDLFTLAGASVGAAKKEWTKSFFDNLELGIKLHGIKEVWCFDHLDCGMYKATFNLKEDLDPKIHIQCMDKLKDLVHKKHPELKFREFMVDAKGHVSSIQGGVRKVIPKIPAKPGPKKSAKQLQKETYYVPYTAYAHKTKILKLTKEEYNNPTITNVRKMELRQEMKRWISYFSNLRNKLNIEINAAVNRHDDPVRIQLNRDLLANINKEITDGRYFFGV